MFSQSLVTRASSAALFIALAGASVPALGLPAAIPAAQVNGWGVPLTDVTPDPSIRYGTLPNGMKYAIMRNSTPKGTASVRLQFGFGSIAETESERGLAHFIEHMAFNGTTHVPEGEMVKMLERQGLAFGPDTNAVTGFDTTTYMLELPQSDAQHIDTALFLFREVASEVKFDQSSVDRERGVILGEERQRDTFRLRQAVHQLSFDFPETPYPNRLPIGLDGVIKTASSEALLSLYHRYYRPENATLVFVGDADPSEIEAKIRTLFGNWQPIGPSGAPLNRGRVDVQRPAEFSSFADPAVETSVDYSVTRPWRDPADTMSERRRSILEAIATGIFNRRLQRLCDAPGSPLLGAGMASDEQRGAALVTSLEVASKDGSWKDALDTSEQEIRRAMQFGFTAAELRTETTELLGSVKTLAMQADTRPNAALAGAILAVVGRDRFVTSPKVMAPGLAALIRSATLAKVNAAFRQMWTGSPPLIDLSTKEAITPQQLASAFASSRAVKLEPEKDKSPEQFAYSSFGAPGRLVEDSRIADLDVRTVRFANNVRLNIKRTSFEQGKVRFLVRLGEGLLDLPKTEPGLASLMTLTSSQGGLRKHSLDELDDMFAGKTISVGAAVTADAFVATGATSPGDLGLQMKVSAAYLLDPGFRPEAASQWANIVPVLEKQLDAEPQTVAGVRLPVLLASGDERFGIPRQSELAKRNFSEAKAALAPVIASAPIEITIVGDVSEDAAIKAVAASFGALPTRKLSAPDNKEARKVMFRTDRKPILLLHDGPADKAVVELVWPTTDDSNYRELVGMQLLKDVLDIMLTESVREKLGDSYGVNVGSSMSDIFTGFGYLSAAAVVAPNKADEVEQAIAEAASQLRDKPVSEDLIARARNPELEGADKALHDNGFWIAALSKAQSDPQKLDRVRQRKAVLRAISPLELQQLARKYLEPGRVQQVKILSSKMATTASR